MIKSKNSIYQLAYPATGEMTPIRDYAAECQLQNRNLQQGKVRRNPYSESLWEALGENKRTIQRINTQVRNRHRPRSLKLEQEADIPVRKKVDSPLNLRTFGDYMTLKSPKVDPKLLNTLDVVKRLVQTEREYIKKLELGNSVYRFELQAKKVGSMLLDKERNDELLLFGDLETLASVSKILVKQLEEKIAEAYGGDKGDSDQILKELRVHPDKLRAFIERLDIGTVLEHHFERIKYLYLTYSVNHQKQLELLQQIRRKHSTIYFKWYDRCLQKADLIKLEDILKLPVERLRTWGAITEQVLLYTEGISSDLATAQLSDFYDQYCVYLRGVSTSERECNCEAKANLELTPTQIIHFYECSVDPEVSAIDIKRKKSQSTALSVNTGTSSAYSEPNVLPSNKISDCKSPDSDYADLDRSICQFFSVRKGLQDLLVELEQLDLAEIICQQLANAKTWHRLMDFEPHNENCNNSIYISSIYTAFIDKLNHQREEISVLRVKHLKKGVIDPLLVLLARTDSVRGKIDDLKVLSKEYKAYMKQRDYHDIKKKVMAQSFEDAQALLAKELPQFMAFMHKSISYLLLRYHSLVLEYLKILCGGEKLLKKELTFFEESERELGDNFDILQMFSSSRFYTKQAVRGNWQFPGIPSASRVLRKLFEL
ncbi:ABL013Cp [Eremothecium gossypii ATCC 10895]|uniref:ABL013Cp n=1 Tax=Eremothecium gossypii (strain ATCC 10895 / CBS 109.51 / FGSC 9923 / NRRL Y-1056) TaxID=284811 RepID=Q75DN0_EREGS|nr:ABL013Cp [Eremothecium gossypii ATCC 10895]AAS50758.2 ABL013Cp [Eremothecium gossypii ATCC 10895]